MIFRFVTNTCGVAKKTILCRLPLTLLFVLDFGWPLQKHRIDWTEYRMDFMLENTKQLTDGMKNQHLLDDYQLLKVSNMNKNLHCLVVELAIPVEQILPMPQRPHKPCAFGRTWGVKITTSKYRLVFNGDQCFKDVFFQSQSWNMTSGWWFYAVLNKKKSHL